MWDIDSARNVACSVGLRRSRIDKKDLVPSYKGLIQIPGVDFVLELGFVVPNLILHAYLPSSQPP
jgi:hypothetical protein